MSETVVKGYKVFNPDWTCNPNGNTKQYTCPGKFEEDVEPIVCDAGMHFCEKATDCFNYYQFNPKNKVAEVAAYGTVVEDGDKCCTDKLEIIREIPWGEVLEIVNVGEGNTGRRNTGDCNSGDCNIGNLNTGNENSGDLNTGDKNIGNYNTGCENSGNRNTGDYNSGKRNSGDWNIGNFNTGDWNKTNFSNGCFNTIEQKIYLFNKPSNWTYLDWIKSNARTILSDIKNIKYLFWEEMTDEEKKEYLEAEDMNNYSKNLSRQKYVMKWWKSLKEEEQNIVMSIPNFDKEIFKEITGIDVDEK